MELIERNGLRILTCEFGYLLHNKVTDTYSEKVYLGKFASVDEWEKVEDDTVDKRMLNKVKQIDSRIDNIEQDTELVDMLNEIINE